MTQGETYFPLTIHHGGGVESADGGAAEFPTEFVPQMMLLLAARPLLEFPWFGD